MALLVYRLKDQVEIELVSFSIPIKDKDLLMCYCWFGNNYVRCGHANEEEEEEKRSVFTMAEGKTKYQNAIAFLCKLGLG